LVRQYTVERGEEAAVDKKEGRVYPVLFAGIYFYLTAKTAKEAQRDAKMMAPSRSLRSSLRSWRSLRFHQLLQLRPFMNALLPIRPCLLIYSD
jgi:hypothetical protein